MEREAIGAAAVMILIILIIAAGLAWAHKDDDN